ncbi:MAG: DUF481 domain-containing protein [Gammaproteobacteria bacterium]|nr:MAG: DUF481 domain-containing protein [Gammaproteobacteria bacterium]
MVCSPWVGRMIRFFCLVIFLVLSTSSFAFSTKAKEYFWYQKDEQKSTDDKENAGWEGSAELGLIYARGNSNTDTLQAKLNLSRDGLLWRPKLAAQSLKTKDSGETTADRYQMLLQADRKFKHQGYAFVAVNHEVDHFSGFDYQSSIFAGYGRDFKHGKAWQASVEFGPGYRVSEPEVGETEAERIWHIAGRFKYKFNDTAYLEGAGVHDRGNEQAISQMSLGFGSKINTTLALKVSYDVRHNSMPPAGVKSIDRVTAINLVVSF